MHRIILYLLTVVMVHFGIAQQNVAINSTGTLPHASAQLDISSTTKGVLIPRMNGMQRVLITSPATGLLVFDVTTNSFWYYDGMSWINLAASSTSWLLNGNTGTNPLTNYIGTNDNTDLRFKINNINAGLLATNGNIFWGINSGNGNTTGNQNTSLGFSTLVANTTGYGNTAIGSFSLYQNNTGFANIAIGVSSLQYNASGYTNVALGWQTLYSNTTGSNNVAAGGFTLNSNTTGYSNVAIGAFALFNNSNRGNLVAIGDSALFNNGTGATLSGHAKYNTAIGSKALFTNTTGFDNTATGSEALYSNSSGSSNTATGSHTLWGNTTGQANTSIGSYSLFMNSTGNTNTAIGQQSLINNNGSSNTAVGANSLFNNTTGNYNTAVGFSATVVSGNLENATAIGAKTRVDCSNCMVLGSVNGINTATSNVKVGIGTTNPQATLHLGNDGVLKINDLSGTRYIQLFHSNTGNLHLDAFGGGTNYISWYGGSGLHVGNGTSAGYGPVNASAFVVSSSVLYKKEIRNIRYGLAQILQLQGKEYKYISDTTNRKEIGLIAEDVEKILPEVVYRNSPDKQITGIDYGKLTPVLIEAIKELQKQIDELKKENAEIKRMLTKDH
jgi:hypothetical protein